MGRLHDFYNCLSDHGISGNIIDKVIEVWNAGADSEYMITRLTGIDPCKARAILNAAVQFDLMVNKHICLPTAIIKLSADPKEEKVDFDPKKEKSVYDLADPRSLGSSPIKVFFYAEPDSTDQPNFRWVSYEMIFKRTFNDKMGKFLDARHYKYNSGLTNYGKGTDPKTVEDKNKEKTKFDMTVSEAEESVSVHGKKLLKGPDLVPHGLSRDDITYINTYEKAKKSYDWEGFRREFGKDIYTVAMDEVGKKFVNPVKKLLGGAVEIKPEEKKAMSSIEKYNTETLIRHAMKAAEEKIQNHPDYFTGGFSIMKDLEKKLLEKQHKDSPVSK